MNPSDHARAIRDAADLYELIAAINAATIDSIGDKWSEADRRTVQHEENRRVKEICCGDD